MSATNDTPTVIADDAPTPDQFEGGEEVRSEYNGQIAFDHDGARYCPDCVTQEYADLCIDDPDQIPYGGPVAFGAEADCPGYYACGHCLRKIVGFTTLHYDVVCGPNCPEN